MEPEHFTFGFMTLYMSYLQSSLVSYKRNQQLRSMTSLWVVCKKKVSYAWFYLLSEIIE